MLRLLTILTFVLLAFNSAAQQATAVLRVKGHQENAIGQRFAEVLFNFNGREFSGNDSGDYVLELNTTFANCTTITEDDTLLFYTQFLKDSIYLIQAAANAMGYEIAPIAGQQLGSITYTNYGSKERMLIIDPMISELIQSHGEYKTRLSDSIVLTGIPIRIALFKPNFYGQTVHYAAKNKVTLRLFLPRDQDALFTNYFLFLHGENIRLDYKERFRKGQLMVNDFLLGVKP